MAPSITTPAAPPLFTCSQIARSIAETRGHCNRSSVWRAITRLKIRPFRPTPHIALYTKMDKARIEQALRKPNGHR